MHKGKSKSSCTSLHNENVVLDIHTISAKLCGETLADAAQKHFGGKIFIVVNWLLCAANFSLAVKSVFEWLQYSSVTLPL